MTEPVGSSNASVPSTSLQTEEAWQPVLPLDALPIGEPHTLVVQGVPVVLVRPVAGGDVYALRDRCPHQQASFAGGSIEPGSDMAGRLVCPLHAWSFDIETGSGPGGQNDLATAPVRIDEGHIHIDPERLREPGDDASGSETESDDEAGLARYLVRYGRLGWVVICGSIEEFDLTHRREVVIQTERGMELAEVLSWSYASGANRLRDRSTRRTGEMLRPATPDDQQAQTKHDRLTQTVLERVQNDCVPVEVVDAETLLDGLTVVLYYLGESSLDLGPLAIRLGEGLPLRVQFTPLIDPPPSPAPPGAGGGCGCGSGGGCGA